MNENLRNRIALELVQMLPTEILAEAAQLCAELDTLTPFQITKRSLIAYMIWRQVYPHFFAQILADQPEGPLYLFGCPLLDTQSRTGTYEECVRDVRARINFPPDVRKGFKNFCKDFRIGTVAVSSNILEEFMKDSMAEAVALIYFNTADHR